MNCWTAKSIVRNQEPFQVEAHLMVLSAFLILQPAGSSTKDKTAAGFPLTPPWIHLLETQTSEIQ